MNTKDVDILDLESIVFQLKDPGVSKNKRDGWTPRTRLSNDPVKSTARISTGEDVFVHEQAPNEILVLPHGPNAGDLEQENAVVVEKVVDLAQELAVAADADVFGHLERDDLGERARSVLDVPEVLAEDAGLGGVDAVRLDPPVSKRGLLAGEGDAGRVDAVVLRGEGDERAPSAPDVQQAVARLEPEFFANDGELVVLELFEGFFLFEVGDDAAGVDHAWPKEPLHW